MPTYAYRCPECGHAYDAFQKMSAKSRAKCPECGARGERQISGGAGLVFKGSGFYITDYKRAGEPKGDKAAEKGDQAATGKGDAKTSSGAKSESGGSTEKTPKKSKGTET
jgi:putative FmdB family regulatory protein